MDGFTLTIDYLAFTLPSTTIDELTGLLGGTWTKVETGWLGYPLQWVCQGDDRGHGRIGMGAARNPREAHVDLTAGIVASWSLEKLHAVLQWVNEKTGKETRMDCALDDRKRLVSLALIKDAIRTGQIVTRAKQAQVVTGENLELWATTGETISIGSRRSQTFLRIYDKQMEMQAHGRPEASEYGIRWEVEVKKDRAHALGTLLRLHPIEAWRELVVGVLQSYVDFRETSKEAEAWARFRAPRMAWWMSLCEGFKQCRLVVEQARKTIEDVKDWVTRSLAPMLAVVAVAPSAGQSWLEEVIAGGAQRWKDRHLRLLQKVRPNHLYVLNPA